MLLFAPWTILGNIYAYKRHYFHIFQNKSNTPMVNTPVLAVHVHIIKSGEIPLYTANIRFPDNDYYTWKNPQLGFIEFYFHGSKRY